MRNIKPRYQSHMLGFSRNEPNQRYYLNGPMVKISTPVFLCFMSVGCISSYSFAVWSIIKWKSFPKILEMATSVLNFQQHRSSHQRCSIWKCVLRNFTKFYFNKVAGLKPTTLWKRDSSTGAFLLIL